MVPRGTKRPRDGPRPPRPPQGTFTFGHYNEKVNLAATGYASDHFKRATHGMRRISAQQVEKIRAGDIGSTFPGGQVWTADFLTDERGIKCAPNLALYGLLEFENDTGSIIEFPTLNLDQAADKYSNIQLADLRKEETPTEKKFENLRFVSRKRNEIPIYHYWVVPERGDQETPNLNDTSTKAPSEFPEEKLTQQQLDSLAIDEHAADRQYKALKEQFDEDIKSGDRRIRPPKIFDGQVQDLENQIDPKSAEFNKELNHYCQALRAIPDDKSLFKWMEEQFSAERVLLLDASIHDGLREIQDEQKELYRELLRTDAFREFKSNTVLKFTMAYFGLPVQPLTLKDGKEARKGEHPKTGLRDANAFDKNGDDEEDDGMFGSKVVWYSEKPLEFLDTYHERNLGYPMLRK